MRTMPAGRASSATLLTVDALPSSPPLRADYFRNSRKKRVARLLYEQLDPFPQRDPDFGLYRQAVQNARNTMSTSRLGVPGSTNVALGVCVRGGNEAAVERLQTQLGAMYDTLRVPVVRYLICLGAASRGGRRNCPGDVS